MKTETHRDRSELLAEALSEEIIDGRLRPGEKLNEADLSERFAVSRGPIREALKRLGERKLVVFYPNAGARVVTHTLSDILNLLEVREYLEAAAAKLAAVHMTEAEKKVLRELYEAHAAAVGSTPDGSYLQHPEDLDFHYVIIKGAKNPLLFDLLCGDLYPRLRISRRAHKASPGRGARALEEHRRILVAIEEGDPEFAELLMRKHIAAAREGLRRLGEFPSG